MNSLNSRGKVSFFTFKLFIGFFSCFFFCNACLLVFFLSFFFLSFFFVLFFSRVHSFCAVTNWVDQSTGGHAGNAINAAANYVPSAEDFVSAAGAATDHFDAAVDTVANLSPDDFEAAAAEAATAGNLFASHVKKGAIFMVNNVETAVSFGIRIAADGTRTAVTQLEALAEDTAGFVEQNGRMVVEGVTTFAEEAVKTIEEATADAGVLVGSSSMQTHCLKLWQEKDTLEKRINYLSEPSSTEGMNNVEKMESMQVELTSKLMARLHDLRKARTECECDPTSIACARLENAKLRVETINRAAIAIEDVILAASADRTAAENRLAFLKHAAGSACTAVSDLHDAAQEAVTILVKHLISAILWLKEHGKCAAVDITFALIGTYLDSQLAVGQALRDKPICQLTAISGVFKRVTGGAGKSSSKMITKLSEFVAKDSVQISFASTSTVMQSADPNLEGLNDELGVEVTDFVAQVDNDPFLNAEQKQSTKSMIRTLSGQAPNPAEIILKLVTAMTMGAVEGMFMVLMEILTWVLKIIAEKTENRMIQKLVGIMLEEQGMFVWMVTQAWYASCGQFGTVFANVMKEFFNCNVCELDCPCTVPRLTIRSVCKVKAEGAGLVGELIPPPVNENATPEIDCSTANIIDPIDGTIKQEAVKYLLACENKFCQGENINHQYPLKMMWPATTNIEQATAGISFTDGEEGYPERVMVAEATWEECNLCFETLDPTFHTTFAASRYRGLYASGWTRSNSFCSADESATTAPAVEPLLVEAGANVGLPADGEAGVGSVDNIDIDDMPGDPMEIEQQVQSAAAAAHEGDTCQKGCDVDNGQVVDGETQTVDWEAVFTNQLGAEGSLAPCRADTNADCPTWAAAGECDTNPGYMHQNCMRSCNILCPRSGSDEGHQLCDRGCTSHADCEGNLVCHNRGINTQGIGSVNTQGQGTTNGCLTASTCTDFCSSGYYCNAGSSDFTSPDLCAGNNRADCCEGTLNCAAWEHKDLSAVPGCDGTPTDNGAVGYCGWPSSSDFPTTRPKEACPQNFPMCQGAADGGVTGLCHASGAVAALSGCSDSTPPAVEPEVEVGQGSGTVSISSSWTDNTALWTDRPTNLYASYTFVNPIGMGRFNPTNFDYLIKSTVNFRNNGYQLRFPSPAEIVVFHERNNPLWATQSGWSNCDIATMASPPALFGMPSTHCYMKTAFAGEVVHFHDGRGASHGTNSGGGLTTQKTIGFVKLLPPEPTCQEATDTMVARAEELHAIAAAAAALPPVTGVGFDRCHSGCTDNSGCGNGLVCHVRQSNLVQNDWTRNLETCVAGWECTNPTCQTATTQYCTTTTIHHPQVCHRCSRRGPWYNRYYVYGSHRCTQQAGPWYERHRVFCTTPSPTSCCRGCGAQPHQVQNPINGWTRNVCLTTTVTQVDNIAPCPATQADLIAAGVNSCPRTTTETGNSNEAVRGCSGNPAANTNYCVIP